MEEMYKVCEVKLTYRTKVKSSERAVIKSSNDAYSLLSGSVYDSDTIQYREYLKLVLLNKANKVLGVVHLSEGGTSETSADLKIIMQAAILANASGMILSHNHPSGNLQPSKQDDVLTENLSKAAKLFNIHLLDHLIVSDCGYYSYSDEGRLA